MCYRCICGVLADKLVVLVTHQLQYAQHADSILVLKQVLSYVTIWPWPVLKYYKSKMGQANTVPGSEIDSHVNMCKL